MRATILAAVDPYANLLRPIRWRRLVALGLLAWGIGGLAAALGIWALRLNELLSLGIDPRASIGLVRGVIVCLGMSAAGALAFVRPHSGLSARHVAAAAAGCAAYAGLAWVSWRIHAVHDVWSAGPYLRGDSPDPERALLRLLFAALLLVVLLGLRPNARVLAARSLLLREGRVDRQTILAMAAAVLVGSAGDGLHLLASALPHAATSYVLAAGTILIAVSSMFLTLGLVGIVIDAWRIARVVLEPAPSYTHVFGQAPATMSGQGADAPAHGATHAAGG